ncbi:putative Glycerol-3-phosphate ABC transporter, permease protein [uncultured Alphaproteobacteria bacterium]|uniref:Putative Glycerol-3-phosphate ABC transporter, permease protein n=1 Tax=uncultured Alphaproteobacteria bacterium TaxID=91750 RepID=A0A212J6Q5_9PROT|nr:putative Glycerol-3-phosphate ABC transporter, permease protein [uncultured Alphaproteobacteria bacterium]
MRIKDWATGYLLILPAAAVLAAFTHVPIVRTVYDSLFSRGSAIRPARFVGFGNFETLAADPVFWKVLGNNLVFALGTVPASIALALAMALLVDRKLRGRGVLRLAYSLPTMLPMVAAANLWLFFYTPGIGLLDQILGAFGASGRNWLGDPATVLPCLIAMTVWKEAGFFMIFYLAALQTQPPELKEAARLEGAGRWTYFRRVLFPMLMPTTMFVLINAVLNAFKLVDHLFVLTKGGPSNASNLLLYYIFEHAFAFNDLPMAAALTVVLLGLLAILAVSQFVFLDKRVHYR